MWTVQCFLIEMLRDCGLPYRVFNDYPILPGSRRSISCDLAIVRPDDTVGFAITEFTYDLRGLDEAVDRWLNELDVRSQAPRDGHRS